MPSLLLPFSHSRYLHLPKTGGTWCRQALHKSGVKYELCNPELDIRGGHTGYYYQNYSGFSFSFIRNPFDWYKSLFKFNALAKVNPSWEMYDINKFVRNVLAVGESLYSLSKYYFGEHYEIAFIGKYENLVEDFIDALNFLPRIEVFDERAIRDFGNVRVNNTDLIECQEYDQEVKNLIFAADNYIFRRFKY